MPNSINVVVTCTKRKSVAVPDRLKLRRVRRADAKTKIGLWRDRLEACHSELVAVRDLYSGDHWSIAKAMEGTTTFGDVGVRLWVASAGYGLISLDDSVKPYSATYSIDHPDSVVKRTTGNDRPTICREWWTLMSQWNGPVERMPRTLTEVAAASPNSPLIVVASENYLLGINDDLCDARDELNEPELLSIFSAGCKSLNGLARHLVPYDARLQRVVGGALRSLNMRAAQKALHESRRSQPTLPVLRRKFKRLLDSQPPLDRPERLPMTDAAVCRFIKQAIRRDADVSHTPLLRKLRDGGHACEQKRFAKLFRQVREQLNGS